MQVATAAIKKKLTSLLETVFIRRAVIKVYEKETARITALLQKQMDSYGFMEIEGSNGGYARFGSKAQTKMPSAITTILKNFDARTMAALLADSTISQGKQTFLSRVGGKRDFLKGLMQTRSNSFSVNLPRTKEQLAMMSTAIKAGEDELDNSVTVLMSAYRDTEGKSALPDNLKVDKVLAEGTAKKVTKTKIGKKKVGKKKAVKKKGLKKKKMFKKK